MIFDLICLFQAQTEVYAEADHQIRSKQWLSASIENTGSLLEGTDENKKGIQAAHM